MEDNFIKKLTFDEDTFDINTHKKAATVATRKKARIKRNRRKIAVGKIVLTIAALMLAVLLYYFISTSFLHP